MSTGKASTHINLQVLSKALAKHDIFLKPDEIIRKPDPHFETPQIVAEFREMTRIAMSAKKPARVDLEKSTLNAWTRADILYRLGH